MLPLSVLLQHSLLYGSVLSVLMSGVILVSLYLCPQIWVDDAPADIQRAVGPMSARDRQLKRLVGIPTLLAVLGILLHALLRLSALGNGAITFGDAALSTFLIIQVFNLVDLVLIDWLVLVNIRPSFLVVPGTEQLQGYRAYRFHFVAFLQGVVGSLIISLLIAGITVAIMALPHQFG